MKHKNEQKYNTVYISKYFVNSKYELTVNQNKISL